MEGPASKKRKVCHDEAFEEDDEQKMEKFFALIRSIRETSEYIMNGSNELQNKSDNKKKMKKVDDEEKSKAVWKPSFQREDFAEDVKLTKSSCQIKEGSDGTYGIDLDGL
ncbi:hypothetical protein F0562_021500 [Nyssa sinensis]|uniref:Uncharacterized protein n=1 Tax=Nyssa sinensis TaxID=561372 RepID=A0A5J5BIM1_9ASTE|nr:hypothetical protein F0562_021500 [Nyssa sinensis]